ncbi:uncharacterized protein LOC119671510 isoform X2 [Teleopsis dalmanni]|uniref:uncharacterized protein LOC119671510 isoform X2 n=1 Tax=Teleopsis dalmanni TaxID=139649 RepID=UPI0018CFBAA1|nr:uncharacterized protein LOC119671510 isoform X2 [Teleopsis dalmanni]
MQKEGTMSANANRKFESVFRIDGKPILPPLVTADMKIEFQKLKVKAIELEKQFADCRRKQRECEDKTIGSDNSEKAETIVQCNNVQCQRGRKFSRDLELDASFQTITNWLKEDELNNNYKLTKTNPPSYNAQERLKKLKLTETVAFDNHFKSVIYPTNNVIKYLQNEYTVVHMSKVSNQCWIIIDVSKLDKFKEKPKRTRNTNDEIKAKVPSICVCPPTPQTEMVVLKDSIATEDNTTFLHIAHADQTTDDDSSSDTNSPQPFPQDPPAVERRLTLSCSQSDSSLVRSSSFTLIEPSPALRNHMLINKLECGSLDSLNMSQQINVATSNSANHFVEHRRRSSIRDDSDSDATINNMQPEPKGATRKKPETQKTFNSTGNKLNDSLKNNSVDSYSANQVNSKYRSPYTISKKATDTTLTAKHNPHQPASRNQLSSSATRDTIESKAKRVQKVNTKKSPSPPFKQQRRYPSGYNANILSARSSTMSQKPHSPYDNKCATARGQKPTIHDRYSLSNCNSTPTIQNPQRRTPSRNLLTPTENQLFTSIVKQEEERKRLINALNAEKNLLICNAKHRTVVIPDVTGLTSSSSIQHSDAETNKTCDGITSLESSYCDGITLQNARPNSARRNSFAGVENSPEIDGQNMVTSRLRSPTVLSKRNKK